MRVLELEPVFHHALLRMFHSSAVDVPKLARLWAKAAMGLLLPDYCWSNDSSWMRTMNVSRIPSEWVVQHVLRRTFHELLADALRAPNWAKFIRERMDLKHWRKAA